MKRNIFLAVLSMGWILFGTSLLLAFLSQKIVLPSEALGFSAIEWNNPLLVFDGAIQCSLTDEALLKRKAEIQEFLFSEVVDQKETTQGYIFYFENQELIEPAMEFIQKERSCCPFFKFDLSILPFDQGFAIQISGSEAAKEMIKDFEN